MGGDGTMGGRTVTGGDPIFGSTGGDRIVGSTGGDKILGNGGKKKFF